MLMTWIPASKFKELTGFTNQDLYHRRSSGLWLEDIVWRKAPDGIIYYNIKEYEQWLQTPRRLSA